MAVIASSREVLNKLRRKHIARHREIAEYRRSFARDVAGARTALAGQVRRGADQTYGWYNPMRYLYRQ